MSLANAAALALERLRSSAAESEARGMLDTVVAQMPVGVAVTDGDGRILYRNSAFDQVLEGVAVENLARDAIGRHLDDSPYLTGELPAARSLSTGEVVVDEEMKVVRADGRTASIAQTSAPVQDGSERIIGSVAVVADVTARKEAELLRDAFLSVLSHELRTPATTISGGAQLLVARGKRLDAATREDLARDIAAESDRLCRMIDDLLVLARAERGVDLTVRNATLVQHRLRSVAAAIAADWPDRTFTCEIPTDVPPVTGDDGYLDQVLWNLLGNAAKYGRREVTTTVTVHGDEIRIRILDDGPGIPPADRERIFELYARLEATSRLPGTGIGLFVVRRLVEAMGGRIGVANWAEGGAAFTFALPRYVETAQLDAVPEPKVDPPAPGHRTGERRAAEPLNRRAGPDRPADRRYPPKGRWMVAGSGSGRSGRTRATQSRRARTLVSNAISGHGMASGAKARVSSDSRVVAGLPPTMRASKATTTTAAWTRE